LAIQPTLQGVAVNFTGPFDNQELRRSQFCSLAVEPNQVILSEACSDFISSDICFQGPIDAVQTLIHESDPTFDFYTRKNNGLGGCIAPNVTLEKRYLGQNREWWMSNLDGGGSAFDSTIAPCLDDACTTKNNPLRYRKPEFYPCTLPRSVQIVVCNNTLTGVTVSDKGNLETSMVNNCKTDNNSQQILKFTNRLQDGNTPRRAAILITSADLKQLENLNTAFAKKLMISISSVSPEKANVLYKDFVGPDSIQGLTLFVEKYQPKPAQGLAPAGPAAGPTTGPAAGPTAGPAAGPTAGPAAGPTTGPTTGPTAGPAAGPAAGPTAGPSTVKPLPLESVIGIATGSCIVVGIIIFIIVQQYKRKPKSTM
jgi:hypothetical protein